MTHRAYKNEYNEEFLRQIINGRIKGLTITGEETEKVVIIAGELEDLQKFAGLMYATPEQIKAVFPDFLTAEEFDKIWKAAVSKAREAVRKAIVEAISAEDGTGYGCTEESKLMMNLNADLYLAVKNF